MLSAIRASCSGIASVCRVAFHSAAGMPWIASRRISTGYAFHRCTVGAISAADRFTLFPEIHPMAETTDDRLRLLIERIERLEEEKKGIGDDIKDVYLEGKAVGYDVKIMRQVVRLRKMAPDDRREMETILDLYKSALGID